jgi:hypothetical protein
MRSVRVTGKGGTTWALGRVVVILIAAIGALLLLGGTARASDPSLLGQWHLDDDNASGGNYYTSDSSGSGNSLQVVGASQVAGRWGNAFSFNGSTDALQSAVKYQPAHVTVLAWVKGSGPGNYKDIVSQGGDPSCSVASYSLYTGAGGGMEFYIATNTTTSINSAAATPASLWDGNWHAVAGVYDGDTVSLYVDGVEVGSPTTATGSSIDYSLPDTTFDVGNFHACSGFAFNGSIDEVRVYNRALSYAEIAELQSSSATSPPELAAETADPTATSVGCSPSTAAVGTAVTCTATVTDTATGASGSPTGTVTFSSDYEGTFSSPGATCELISTADTASTCTVQYTPAVVGIGEHNLTASYKSDASDVASQGTTSITVSPAPPHVVLTAPTSGTTASPVTLSAGGTSGATLLNWSVNGKPVASCNAQTPDATMSLTKSSNVTLTAIGPGGSSSTTKLLTMSSLKPLPSSAYTNLFLQAVTCSGGSSTLDTTAQGGPGAGCTTELEVGIIDATGCLTEITDPTKVPPGEAPILQGMLSQYQNSVALERLGFWDCSNIAHCQTGGGVTISGGHISVSQQASVDTQGLYISKSTVRIDGIDFTPLNGAAIAISPGFQHIVSSDAIVKVDNVPIKTGQINLDVTERCLPSCSYMTVPISSFDSSGLPLAGYFPFSGTANISFVKDSGGIHGEIDANVQLPGLLGGATVSGVLRTTNASGLQLQSFKGTIPNLGWDDIGLTDGEFDFVAPGDWLFYGNLGFGDYTLSLKPDTDHPFNGIVFHNNAFDHAGATFDFGDAPPEIAPGVDLDSVDLSFEEHPTALRGGVTLSVADLADVSGNVVLAFPTKQDPFQPVASDLPGAPAALLAQQYRSGPVIGLGGKVSIVIPDIGTVPVGSGYFLYDFPGYVAVGGEVDYGFDKLVTVGGRLDGQFNVANRRFNLTGNVHGCVADVICGSVDAALSSQGIGICAGDFGGGFKWNDFPTPHLYAKVMFIGTACNINDFEEDHVFTGSLRRPMAAGQARSIVVKRGKPLPEIRLDGNSGAPNVTVTGPGGQSLTGTSAGIHHSGNIIVIQSEEEDETVIGVKKDIPGTYTITLLSGPAITQSWHTTVLPPVSVKGEVTGSGTHRRLLYDVSHESNMNVSFSEVVHGASRVIGTSSGGKGSLGFTTPMGSDHRTIVASVTRDGIDIPDAQHLQVARFSGPRFVTPGHVGELSARWGAGSLLVKWGGAAHAKRYLVTIREHRGAVIELSSRARSLKLKQVAATLAGTVSVQAVSADGTRGAAAKVSYRALRKAATRFLPFSELKAKKKATKKKHK